MNFQYVKNPLQLSAKYQRSQWIFPNVQNPIFCFELQYSKENKGNSELFS